MKRTADNAQKRPLAVLRPRDYAELPPPNQKKQADPDCRFPRFFDLGEEGRTEREHQPSMGRGGSRIFSTHTYIQMYTWCIFRLRQFWKSERHSDQKVSAVHLRSLSPKVVTFFLQVAFPLFWMLFLLWLAFQIFAAMQVQPASARQVANRSKQIFIAGMGVDGGGENGLVSSETLGDPNIPCAAVDIRTSRMPHGVKAEVPVEPGSLLPNSKSVSKLAGGEPITFAADEYRSLQFQAFSLPFFPTVELFKFGSNTVRQNHLLSANVITAAFENVELHSTFGFALGVKDISNIQSNDLVFPKTCAKGQAEDNMIAKSHSMFTADLEQKTLLQFGECFGRPSYCICVVHSIASSRFFVPLTWRRAIATIARESAVIIEVLA